MLVGPKAGPAPEFVFAARDRMDTEYDMMRSARDGRFLYIRNFSPELPYAGHITYRNQSAIMQEWFRLQAEGTLTGPAALWMRTSRPAEELYDTRVDPHQIRNLSAEPAHRAVLERRRRAVTDWMARSNDQGLVNEPEMIQRMWPGGVQPATAQPYILSRRDTEVQARRESMAIQSPTEIVIYVPTQGASIGYTTEVGPNPHWRLYTGPIRVEAPMTLRAKAIRYGYAIRKARKRRSSLRDRRRMTRRTDMRIIVQSRAMPTASANAAPRGSKCARQLPEMVNARRCSPTARVA